MQFTWQWSLMLLPLLLLLPSALLCGNERYTKKTRMLQMYAIQPGFARKPKTLIRRHRSITHWPCCCWNLAKIECYNPSNCKCYVFAQALTDSPKIFYLIAYRLHFIDVVRVCVCVYVCMTGLPGRIFINGTHIWATLCFRQRCVLIHVYWLLIATISVRHIKRWYI